MASASTAERRGKYRRKNSGEAQLWVERPGAAWEKYVCELDDLNEGGVGLFISEALTAGISVLLEGAGIPASADGGRAKGHVAWCVRAGPERFRVGVALNLVDTPKAGATEADLYEILEVNPSASYDTIHKVYRLLAMRLHPDNPDSGSEEAFKLLTLAYQVPSDPEKRAGYDAQRTRKLGQSWKIFDVDSATPGLEQEQRKRRAIMAALYTKRMRTPEQAAIGLFELEKLLGVPREHLEFPLWFMREQGWIAKSDNARFSITAKGVEFAESSGAWQPPTVGAHRMIQAGR